MLTVEESKKERGRTQILKVTAPFLTLLSCDRQERMEGWLGQW